MNQTGLGVPVAPAATASAKRDLIREIQAVFFDKLHLRLDTADADLFETGILDSMSLVKLIVELEKHFSVELPMQSIDLESFRSASRIAEFIASQALAAEQERVSHAPCESC